MSDTPETAELSSETLREQLMLVRTLMKHPGWDLLQNYARAQQSQYQLTALKPIQSMDAVPAGEFAKGVAQGIEEVLSLPTQIVEQVEFELGARAKRAEATQGEDDA